MPRSTGAHRAIRRTSKQLIVWSSPEAVAQSLTGFETIA
jgi:hypothetical protein